MNASFSDVPWFTDFQLILLVFAVSIILFHFLFIRIFPLGNIAWRRVDYIWLTMAFIGLVSSAGAGRELVTKNMLDVENGRLTDARQNLESQLQYELAQPVCKGGVNYQNLPTKEFLEIQMKYATQCSWFNTVRVFLHASDQRDFHYSKPYPSDGDQLPYENFGKALKIYNDEVYEVERIKHLAKMTDIEISARLLGPVILALALALRMTKVTAEIEFERHK